MSSTVFILVIWVFLSRFDRDYDPDKHGNVAAVTMVIATLLAIAWDVTILMTGG